MSASSSELKWVDNHCHFEENDEVALDLQEAANKGVQKFIVVGTDLETSLKAKELSQIFPEKIFATAGIHPHEAKNHQSIKSDDIVKKARVNKKIIGIGESGLDFYYNNSD